MHYLCILLIKMRMLVDIEKVYKANKQLKKEDVRLLAEFLTEQPHLPKFNGKKTQDNWLITKTKLKFLLTEFQLIYFLHSCDYSIERAKKTIDANYTIKLHFPEVFSKRCPNSPEQIAAQDYRWVCRYLITLCIVYNNRLCTSYIC